MSDDTPAVGQTTAAARAGRVVGAALGTARVGARSVRRQIRKNPTADKAYRTAVGVTGGATVALGVALIPLPGPGALVALGGLAMLGSEFEGAKRVSDKAAGVAKKAAARVSEMRAERRQ
ncbi:MAG: PGPGW domain-containing protein [Pseudolysinimonas sp.]